MKEIGKVMEVFIPGDDKMVSKKIGFKIKTKNEELELVFDQNDDNSKIMRGDLVLITSKNISGERYIDINLIDGDF